MEQGDEEGRHVRLLEAYISGQCSTEHMRFVVMKSCHFLHLLNHDALLERVLHVALCPRVYDYPEWASNCIVEQLTALLQSRTK